MGYRSYVWASASKATCAVLIALAAVAVLTLDAGAEEIELPGTVTDIVTSSAGGADAAGMAAKLTEAARSDVPAMAEPPTPPPPPTVLAPTVPSDVAATTTSAPAIEAVSSGDPIIPAPEPPPPPNPAIQNPAPPEPANNNSIVVPEPEMPPKLPDPATLDHEATTEIVNSTVHEALTTVADATGDIQTETPPSSAEIEHTIARNTEAFIREMGVIELFGPMGDGPTPRSTHQAANPGSVLLTHPTGQAFTTASLAPDTDPTLTRMPASEFSAPHGADLAVTLSTPVHRVASGGLTDLSGSGLLGLFALDQPDTTTDGLLERRQLVHPLTGSGASGSSASVSVSGDSVPSQAVLPSALLAHAHLQRVAERDTVEIPAGSVQANPKPPG